MVGPQVATAVVSLVTNPDVGTAVHGLVDTLFTDFLGSFGVVPAISGLLVVALAVFTRTKPKAAVDAAVKEFEDQPGY